MSGCSPSGADAHHHRGRAVTEDHPRGPDVADLVRELLDADDEHRPLHLLQEPGGLGEPVGHPGAGGDEVVGGVGLVDARAGREIQVASDGISRELVQVHTSTAADLLRPAAGLVQRRLGRLQRELLEGAARCSGAASMPVLSRISVGAHRRPVVGGVADEVVVGAHAARRARRPAPPAAASP